MEDYIKRAKKAAHKYAMKLVISPLANKEAVIDVEQGFCAGAIYYKDVMDKWKRSHEIPPHLDIIRQQAYDNFFTDFYGHHQSDELKESVKMEIDAGVAWGIDNYSKTE